MKKLGWHFDDVDSINGKRNSENTQTKLSIRSIEFFKLDSKGLPIYRWEWNWYTFTIQWDCCLYVNVNFISSENLPKNLLQSLRNVEGLFCKVGLWNLRWGREVVSDKNLKTRYLNKIKNEFTKQNKAFIRCFWKFPKTPSIQVFQQM